MFRRLQRVTDRYLDVVLEFVGEIPEDGALQKSVQAQRPVLEPFRRSPAAQAFKRLAERPRPLAVARRGRAAGWNFSWNACCARPAPRLQVLK